jgi:cellulose synthase/poly-beta-1,6-N-acetylglucosamine synthase-like glycosyltransferase
MRKGLVNQIPASVLDDSYISQIIWKKGYKIKYEEKAEAFIKNPETFKDWIKQKKRNTFGELQLRKTTKSSMRGFKEEARGGIIKVFTYPKTMKEIFWTGFLVLARLYVWINATYNAKIKRVHMKKVWVRIETTK